MQKSYRIFKHPDICKVCYVFVLGKALYQMRKVRSSFQKFVNFSFGQFTQPFIEYFSLTSVSLLSFLLASSNHFKTFPIIFLLPCAMNLFMPVIPNESVNKISLFGEMFKILHQCVPLSSLQIMKGYFFPGIIFSNITNLLILSEGKTPRKSLLKSSLFVSLNTFSISKLDMSFYLNRSPIKSSPLFTTESSMTVSSTTFTFLFFILFLTFLLFLPIRLSEYSIWRCLSAFYLA